MRVALLTYHVTRRVGIPPLAVLALLGETLVGLAGRFFASFLANRSHPPRRTIPAVPHRNDFLAGNFWQAQRFESFSVLMGRIVSARGERFLPPRSTNSRK